MVGHQVLVLGIGVRVPIPQQVSAVHHAARKKALGELSVGARKPERDPCQQTRE